MNIEQIKIIEFFLKKSRGRATSSLFLFNSVFHKISLHAVLLSSRRLWNLFKNETILNKLELKLALWFPVQVAVAVAVADGTDEKFWVAEIAHILSSIRGVTRSNSPFLHVSGRIEQLSGLLMNLWMMNECLRWLAGRLELRSLLVATQTEEERQNRFQPSRTNVIGSDGF